MKGMKDPHWIRCPACGETMLGLEDPRDWVDEMAEMDIILGDDRLG